MQENAQGGRPVKATADDALEVFEEWPDRAEPLTAGDVADALDIARRTALNRLDELTERGDVSKKRVGANAAVFWNPLPRERWGYPRDRDTEGTEDAAAETDAVEDAEDAREFATSTDADQTPPASGDAASAPASPETTLPDDVDATEADLEALADVDFPNSRDRGECIDAVLAARAYLRENDGGTMRELVAAVIPEHPVGYDVEDAVAKVEAGERYRGGWWRLVVKPGLTALPDVAKPQPGASEWTVLDDGEGAA